MNKNENAWAFTEILGTTQEVEKALQQLKEEGILHGSLSCEEEKGNKRFVQYYSCNEMVTLLTDEEKNRYERIAVQYRVHIEYTYKGRQCFEFPNNEEKEFSLKYWEWWIANDK